MRFSQDRRKEVGERRFVGQRRIAIRKVPPDWVDPISKAQFGLSARGAFAFDDGYRGTAPVATLDSLPASTNQTFFPSFAVSFNARRSSSFATQAMLVPSVAARCRSP